MWVKDFLKTLTAERNYSELTVQAYAEDLRRFEAYFKEVDEELDWASVDADVIRGWMVQQLDAGDKATSVNRRLSALRSFYTYLLKCEQVKVNPASKVRGPKKAKPLPVFLKESETQQLMLRSLYPEGFEGDRDYAVISMFYETGIRLAELNGLNKRDIDLQSCVLKVTGKRDKQRMIPFGLKLKETIQNYLDSCKERFLDAEQEALFVDNKGVRLSRGRIETMVHHYLSLVSTLHKRSPHVLRHTFATQILNNEGDLGAVKELLGHASITTTEVYTHTTFEELKKVYKKAHPRS